ncbi:MAG: T9SS type A sorting domain-containing protein [Ignavibacteriaceae bacterium]|nr:T9SS type A sorting domain-containing protein [Ignavibacteriaceae bacterium]
MKMIDFLKKGIFLALFVTAFLGSTAFAQTFVNNTNGDDFVGDGSSSNPYKTIAKAIAVTTAGGTISIAADTYSEVNVAVTKALTFVSTTFNNLSTVTITNGITINTAAAADIVSLGVTGQQFNLGTTATALVLTKGNLQITTANVIMGNGATITRTAGTLDNSPSLAGAVASNGVNVTYGASAVDLTSGGELPSDLGLAGVLTVNIGATKKLTIASSVKTNNGAITITTGNVDVNGGLNLTGTTTVTNNSANTFTVNGNAVWSAGANLGNAINNTAAGDIIINGAVTFAHNSTASANTGAINNSLGGNVTLAQGFTITTSASSSTNTFSISATNAGAGNINFNGAVTLTNLTNNAGTVTLTGGTVSGTVANNTALGTLDIKANTTFSGATIGNGNVASVIKLNANTLTLSNAAAAVTNTGKIISATAATIGSGVIAATGTLTTITGGEVPNITLAAGKGLTLNGGVTAYGNLTSAGTVTLGGAFTLKGDYAQNVGGGKLLFGANTFTIEGDWTRTSNVPADVTQGTGQLIFTGAKNPQTFTSGASLILYDVTINKTNATDVLTLGQTVSYNHNFTITKGVLALGDNHIRMITAGGALINNGGYTTSGIGYAIFEAAGVSNISGTATFSNIDVRNGALVTATSNINFSGQMNLRNGSFIVGANTFTFKKDLVAVPSVFVYTDGPGLMTVAGGSVTTAAATTYDLTYTAVGNAVAGAEWTAAGIRNLSVLTGGTVPAANTITGPAAGTSIAGNLTVIAAQTLALGANTLTLTSDNTINNVSGTVTGGFITVTGNGVALTGSTVTADAAEIPSLNVNITAAQSFSSTNIKKLNGSLVVANGSAIVNMNTTTATVTGNVTLTAGSLNLNMASTTSSHVGNVILTDGALTYTRGSVVAQQNIGGTVTLTAGTFTLGSNLVVTGVTSQVAGNLALGAFNYTANANYTRSGAGTLTGTGKLIVGAITLTPGATFQVPNLELVGAAIIFAPMEVTNSLTHTSGVLVDYSNLTFSGNTYTYVAGSILGGTGITFTGSAVTATFSGNLTFPILTINSTGSVTFASNNATPRTITATVFTQTKGDLNLGINTLQADAFTRVAGNWSQSSGYLIMNTAAPTLGTGFAIDNLTIPVAVNVGTDAFTVNKNLVLQNTLTTSADGKLTLGDGVLVERQGNTFTLSNLPTFGATTNLLYSTGAGIVTAKEMPAAVNNMTVNSTTTLATNVTVNGTLSLAAVLTQTASTKLVTMAAGSTVELKIDNASNLNLTIGGAVNIIYNGATVTSPIELGTIASGAHPVTLGDVTIKTATVTVDAATHTFAGKVTFTSGNLAIAGQTINLQGDVLQTVGFFTGVGTLAFTGANNTTLALAGDYTPVAGANFTLNKTNANNSVTVSGGNLDFTAITPNFTKGVLTLGSNVLTLLQSATVGNQPVQGFARTSGVVYGTVKKFIDRTKTVDISKVEFPVGTSEASYRLATFYFNTNLQSSFDLSVGYTPIAAGQAISPALTILGVTVDSTADFGWNVSTSTGLAPSQLFDVEFLGTGYTHYTNVADIRVVSKLGGAIASNPWLAQGGTYQNYEIAAGVPSVRLTNSTGNLVNIPGAFFAFGYKGITPPPSLYSVSGKVQYANATTSPVRNVVVTLNPGGATATTDSSGDFSFAGIVNGSYTLTAACAKPWLSAPVNATDAYMVAQAYAGIVTLSPIQVLAADVNANGAVNNTDALQIVRRFAGLSTSFTAGDWAFIGASITVAGANVTNANLQALAEGDVNASAAADILLQKAGRISLGSSDEALKVNPKESFNVSVKVSENVQLGAVSARFTYPADLVTFEGVSSKVEGLVVRDNAGEVTIGWADLSGGTKSLDLKSGSELFVFKFKPTDNFKSSSKFQLGIQPEVSEFADVSGKTISTMLKTAAVEGLTPEKFALLQNYPNPFNPTTVIQYDLTNKGTVNLSVYNVLGQVVATVVNQVQEAGTYKVNFNGSSLSSGAYFYRINVVTENGKNFNQVLRMMLLK